MKRKIIKQTIQMHAM